MASQSLHKKTHYLSSVISTSLVLFLLGILGLFMYIGNNLSTYLKENVLLMVMLQDEADTLKYKEVQGILAASPLVKTVKYMSKDEAAAEFVAELDQNFLEALGYNPLKNTFEVYIKSEFADMNKVSPLLKELSKHPLVFDLKYQENLLDMVNKNINTLTPILSLGVLMMILVAIALINNTVKLNIFSQRFLIKSMQYVGATRHFIIRPFLVRGLWNGIISGAIASLFVFNVGYLLLYFVPDVESVLPDFHKGINLLLLLFITLCLSLCGILISAGSTWFAARRYLQMKIDDLY